MSWKDKQNNNESDLPELDMDSREEIKPVGKVKRHYKEVYAVFKEVYGTTPPDWAMNTTEQKSADILFEVKGVERVKRALLFYEENKDHEFCPKVYSPTSLNRKWQPLFDFKEKNNL